MNVRQVIRVKCRYCGKFRDPREFVHDTVVGFCWRCLEWHRRALDVLAGGIPHGCQECGRTGAELLARAGGGDLRMRIHVKDGMLQLLCIGCSDAYERKRRDQFAGTPYGHRAGLN